MASAPGELRKRSSSLDLLHVPAPTKAIRPQSVAVDPSLARPANATNSEMFGSMEDGINLLSYRKIGNVRSLTSNERWHSDTNLALNPDQDGSKLTVDKTEMDIDDENEITIHWDIKETVSAKDWIGLYKVDETHPGKWLDYRNRGVSGSKKGELVWYFDRIATLFTKPETKVSFRYYHGNTGDLRAVTNAITVRNRYASTSSANKCLSRTFSVDSHGDADIIHLAIQDLEAVHVKKGMFFSPDSYVKIRVEPPSSQVKHALSHHFKETRTSVCENTTNPHWSDEVFHFMALPNDILYMKVKDRFNGSRPTLLRFLGQIAIPIRQVVEKAKLGLTMSCTLMGRSPHDHVTGSLLFKPTIIPYDANRTVLNGHDGNARSTLDSVVERELDRASVDILSDSSEDDATQVPKPKIKQLTHTNSGTSGDSSIVCMNATNTEENSEDNSTSQSSPVTVPFGSSAVRFTLNEPSTPPPEMQLNGSSDLLNTSMPSILDGLTTSNSLLSDNYSRASTPDMLTAYQRETECNLASVDASSNTKAREEEVTGSDGSDMEGGRFSPPAISTSPPTIQLHVDGEADVDGTSVSTITEEVPVVRPKVIKQKDAIGSDAESPGNSASAWSLENQVGSRENSPENQTGNKRLEEDISMYMQQSEMTSEEASSTGNTAQQSSDRPPLPQPRMKTLAEQLNNLQVIESSVDRSRIPIKPPDLPAKNRGTRSRDASNESKPKKSSPPRQPLSQESLDMPTAPAPPPPTGTRPKKLNKTQHIEVADQYMALDNVDGFLSKKKTTSEQPPELKPRKGRPPPSAEAPPQLPPRRVKGEGAVGGSAAGTDSSLDDVFEPQSTRMPQPQKPKKSGRKHQTPSTESEEARVAAEVANAAASLPRPHHMKSESIEVEEALPAGWEARVDSHGRVFYIDHNNKVTTWTRPTNKRGQPPPLQRIPSISHSDKRNMDHRYRNIQRMTSVDQISERAQSPPTHPAPPPPIPTSSEQITPSTSATSVMQNPSTPPAEGSSTSAATSSAPKTTAAGDGSTEAEKQHKKEVIRSAPAVKFLTRTDFFSLVQYNDEAQVAYTSNSALKHMVHRIRKDPTNFLKYWHNKDLVNFLNMFVNKDDELPEHWQMKLDKSGKVFFLDHATKTTTFIDPRLPTVQPPLNPGQVVPLPRGRYRGEEQTDPNSGDLVPTAYNEKVVMFLRQPGIMQVLQDKYPPLKKNDVLKHRINNIISDGTQALRKYRNHIELTIILSMFENEIMSFVPAHLRHQQPAASQQSSHSEHQQQQNPSSPVSSRRHVAPPYKRDFQEKYRTFLKKLEAKGIGQGPGKIKMRVRRDHILEDSFKKVMSYSKRDLQKNKLLISFLGEEGLDYGGPAREFFFLLSRELFNPYYGLFEYSANDTYTVQISPMSTFVDNAAEWFRFAGRMIGLCIVHQYLMDAFFTRPFYKMLLKELCNLSDLESLDAEFHQSLLWIKDNDISEAGLDLTFSVDEEVFGQVIERELKPGGVSVPVTNKNKKEYIDKMVAWRIDRGVTEQKEYLLRGFYEVLDPKLVSIFDAKDLELVIAGTAEIDVIDWRNNTEYRSGYYDTHPVIAWFWEVIESFDNEKRLRLLQFVTGTSSIPFEGFTALRGSNGPRKFTVEKWGNPESLPRAHTCFNRLDLPAYTNKETMQEKLLLAISETSTFGIE